MGGGIPIAGDIETRVLNIYSGNLWGGIETYLVRLAQWRHLTPKIWCGFALCFEGRLASELRRTGAPVLMLPAARARSPRAVANARRALADAIRGHGVDVVVTHAAWSHAIFGPVAHPCGAGLVTQMHDIPNPYGALDRWAGLVRPDLVLCNSEFTKSTGPWLHPDVARVVSYYPSAVPATPDPRARAHLRDTLGVGAGEVVVLLAARFERWKGHALLIEALGLLRDHPRWTCWVAGGVQRPSEVLYERELRVAVERLGLAGRVKFLGHRDDMPALFRAADIHCQPNVGPEPFGQVFIEALGAGVPVLTTDMGAGREIVTPACGRLAAANSTSVAQHLRALIDDDPLRAELSQGGPARALELCDPTVRVTELGGLWSRLGARTKARTAATPGSTFPSSPMGRWLRDRTLGPPLR
jgi:glycosyltransferase involved in cell wall biosynthesis